MTIINYLSAQLYILVDSYKKFLLWTSGIVFIFGVLCFITLVFLFAGCNTSKPKTGVIGKITQNEHTKEIIYYSGDKQIAKEIIDDKSRKKVGTIPDGIVKFYYDNGKLCSESNWKGDKQNGLEKLYDEYGNLKQIRNYKNDTVDGIQKSYYESGKLFAEETYKENEANGEAKRYYENGKLKLKCNYKDNKLDGVSKEYDINGELSKERYYKNGVLLSEKNYKVENIVNLPRLIRRITKTYPGGQEVTIYNDGKEIAKEIFDDRGNKKVVGKIPDGIVKEYNENGKLWNEESYKDNELNGLAKSYYESGELKVELNYKDGKEDGVGKSYYINGKLRSEVNWSYGRLNGVSKSYDMNGKLERESNYEYGTLNGACKEYHSNGVISTLDYYTYGHLTSRKNYNEKGKLTFSNEYP